MPKQGILKEDTDTLVIYINEYYDDCSNQRQFEPTDEGINEMCDYLGITYKTLKEEISRGRKWTTKSIWKFLKSNPDGDMIRLV